MNVHCMYVWVWSVFDFRFTDSLSPWKPGLCQVWKNCFLVESNNFIFTLSQNWGSHAMRSTESPVSIHTTKSAQGRLVIARFPSPENSSCDFTSVWWYLTCSRQKRMSSIVQLPAVGTSHSRRGCVDTGTPLVQVAQMLPKFLPARWDCKLNTAPVSQKQAWK